MISAMPATTCNLSCWKQWRKRIVWMNQLIQHDTPPQWKELCILKKCWKASFRNTSVFMSQTVLCWALRTICILYWVQLWPPIFKTNECKLKQRDRCSDDGRNKSSHFKDHQRKVRERTEMPPINSLGEENLKKYLS